MSCRTKDAHRSAFCKRFTDVFEEASPNRMNFRRRSIMSQKAHSVRSNLLSEKSLDRFRRFQILRSDRVSTSVIYDNESDIDDRNCKKKSMFDLSLLKDGTYLLVVLSTFFQGLGLEIPFLFLNPR